MFLERCFTLDSQMKQTTEINESLITFRRCKRHNLSFQKNLKCQEQFYWISENIKWWHFFLTDSNEIYWFELPMNKTNKTLLKIYLKDAHIFKKQLNICYICCCSSFELHLCQPYCLPFVQSGHSGLHCCLQIKK